MQRRTFLGSLAAGPLLAQNAQPPNILLVLFDKCRTDAIGAYEEKNVSTPHLDRLAREAMRFSGL